MGPDDDRSQHSAEGFAAETARSKATRPLTSRPPPPGSATATMGKRVQAIVGATVGFLLAVILALVIVFVSRSTSQQGTSASASGTAGTGPETTTDAPVASSPITTAPAASTPATPTTGPDADAVAALEKLRTGLADCTKRIGNLPGTSKTVPADLSLVAKGPHTPRPGDFSSPSFQCSQYKLKEPMTFVLQWQYFGGGIGKGVAWVDADADGTADRAWGFDAKVEEKGPPTFGDIKAIDAATKPETPR